MAAKKKPTEKSKKTIKSLDNKKQPAQKKPKTKAVKKVVPDSIPAFRAQIAAKNARHRRRLKRTIRYEMANSMSHGIGAGMAIAGMIFLIFKGIAVHEPLRIVAYTIFGSSLTVLYLASTLYHSLPSPRAKSIFRRIDHASIYLAIAGSYTPVTLIALGGSLGWTLFSIVWFFAAAGIFYKSAFKTGHEFISVSLYIATGWMIVFAIEPLMESVNAAGLWLFISGGLAYTLGVIFYSLEKLPYHHMIWHLFVLAGSITHFIAIYLFV